MTLPPDTVAGATPRPGGRTRWLAAGALALVFLAGGGTGWGLAARYGAGDGHGRRRGPRAGMLLDAGPIARYQLAPGQRVRVDSILRARSTQIAAFWQGPGRQLRAILDSTAADVRTVLTPAQQATFDSARAEHQRRVRERFRARFGTGGGTGGPGPPVGPPGPR